MSISSLQKIFSSRSSVSLSAPSGEWKSPRWVRTPSRSLSWRFRPVQKPAGRGALRISACAAPPCDLLKVSAPAIENVGLGGVTFESSALRTVKDGLVFLKGRAPELIRAAAYLRALSFYKAPEGRIEEALQLHRKMKAEDEFRSLISKVGGLEQGYKRVMCLLALYPVSSLRDSSLINLHPALKVTLENGEEHVLVGSLDLNQGKVFTGGIMVRARPKVGSSFHAMTETLTLSSPSTRIQAHSTNREQGYLSNVCVAPMMRQRGIGVALLQQALQISQLQGITNLYVHVVPTNEAAVKLYNRGGFTVEKEEAATIERRQAQPRRLLLHKFI